MNNNQAFSASPQFPSTQFPSMQVTGPATPAPKRFARDTRNNWLGGVCAGIARYLGVAPALVRALFVVSCLLPGPQVLIYLALWILMPKE